MASAVVPWEPEGEIPKGFCQCGCGGKTQLADKNSRSKGDIAGLARKFLKGHNRGNLGKQWDNKLSAEQLAANKAIARRQRRLSRLYNLTEAQVTEMIEAQGNLCKICRKNPPEVVDHCHSTHRVRGILCNACNLILGHAGDDIRVLQQAISYLGGI